MRLPSLLLTLMAVSLVAFAQEEGEAPPVQEMRLKGTPEREPETPAREPAAPPTPTPTDEAPAGPAPEEAAPEGEEPVPGTEEEAADKGAQPGQEKDAAMKALESRLADQQEEIATLRRQLEESQRQSEQLEEVVTELDNVELSVDDLHAFEQQRALLAERRTQALAGSVELLNEAGRALYYGSADVLPLLEAAGATLEGEAQRATLVAAAYVRRGDLFNARAWVDFAHQLAHSSLEAEGGGAVNVPP